MHFGALGDIHGDFASARRIMERHSGVPFWVSGGVLIDDIGAYLKLGVKAVGLTSSVFPADALARKDWETIRANAARAAAVAQQPTL